MAVKALGRRSLPCVTKDLRLRGAGRNGYTPPRPGGVDPTKGTVTDAATEVAAHLAGRYGTETPDVLAVADGRPDLLEPLVPGLHYLRAEAVYAVRQEMAGSVADVLDRRTRASLRDARGAADSASAVADLIGAELGWDAERIRSEGDEYAARVHAVLQRAGLPDTVPTPPAGSAGHHRPDRGLGGRRRTGGRVTEPTPVTPVDAEPGLVTDRLGGVRVEVDDSLRRRLARRVRSSRRGRRLPGRGRPGLVAPGHRVGRRRPGTGPARGGGPAHRHRPGFGRPGPLPRRPGCRLPPPGAAAGCVAPPSPCSAGWPWTCAGWPASGAVDDQSLVADLRAGTFGPDVEAGLRGDHGLTLGHWPQSMDLSTVGGWLACRGAGQYSNRYGKIEDMVTGLEVVLADGRVVRTGGHAPRSATGPDLTQLFVGSEGTLGRHHRGTVPGPPGAGGRGPAGLRIRHLRRRARGLPADPAARRHPGRPPPVRPDRVGTVLRPTRLGLVVQAEHGRGGAPPQDPAAGVEPGGEGGEAEGPPALAHRHRVDPEPSLGDDPEGALAAHEELGQVGTRGRAGRVAAGADHPAVGQHHLQADDHVLDLPVAVGVLAGPRQASHPPTVDKSIDWGQWPRVRPCSPRRPASTSGPKVPARRSATSDWSSTAPMPASPHRSRATPPNRGMEAPHTPLRPPAAVTGTRASWQRARTAETGRCRWAGPPPRAGPVPGRRRPTRWPGATSHGRLRPGPVVLGDFFAYVAQLPAQGVVDVHPHPAQAVGDQAGLGVDGVTGVGSVIPRPVRRQPPRPPSVRGGGRPGGVGGVRNSVRQSGPLQHGVHLRRGTLSLVPDAVGVPAELGTDQVGHPLAEPPRPGRHGARPGSCGRARRPPSRPSPVGRRTPPRPAGSAAPAPRARAGRASVGHGQHVGGLGAVRRARWAATSVAASVTVPLVGSTPPGRGGA